MALLRQGGADGYTWVAAAVGVNSAAGIQLATGEPVMAIGATSVGGATVYDLTAG